MIRPACSSGWQGQVKRHDLVEDLAPEGEDAPGMELEGVRLNAPDVRLA
jgi:hypothetical protein